MKVGDEIKGLGKVIDVKREKAPSPSERYIKEGIKYGMSTYAIGYSKEQELFITDEMKKIVEEVMKEEEEGDSEKGKLGQEEKDE